MSFKYWLQETKQRYQKYPPKKATIESARNFAAGVSRRALDPYIGSSWWKRSDWNVLIIMDACRIDLARETLNVPVAEKTSNASTSIDWINRHFAEKYKDQWTNTGYVTANPFADHNTPDAFSADLSDKPLGAFEPVYKNKWSKKPVGTTPPSAVTEKAIQTWPDVDRMIVHYMQPHQPFRSRPEWETVFSNLEDLTTDLNQGGRCIWKRIRDGEIDYDEAWSAYADNLKWVWSNAHNKLLPQLDGAKTIFTADHGNALGEWGSWGHRGGMLQPSVRKVPVMGPYTESLDVESTTTNVTYEDDVENRLAALGYCVLS